MGKLLQIRVMAQTVRDDDVEQAYPTLAKLAWSEPRPTGVPRGVLELPEALFEHLSMGDWPEDLQSALRPGVSETMGLRGKLNSALADWQPQEADTLSYQLEDALETLERKAKELA